jgi:hypothetical protein
LPTRHHRHDDEVVQQLLVDARTQRE